MHLERDKISHLKKWFETQNKYSGISLCKQIHIHIVCGSVYGLEKMVFYTFHTKKMPTKIEFSCKEKIDRSCRTGVSI